MTRTLTFVLTAILSLPVAAQQTTPAQDPKPKESAKAANPADFVMKAAEQSRKAVIDGTLAMEKSSNADVRTLARRMVVDHTAALEELAKIAKEKSITLTVDPKVMSKPATGEVTALEGPAYDRTYVDQTVTELMQVLPLYQAETDDGKDPVIEDWADKKMELLEVQLKMAKDLQAKVSR